MTRLLFLFLIVLVSCVEPTSDHPIFKYYPPSDVVEDGYVSMFYSHYYPDNPDRRAATQIYYTKHMKLDDSAFVMEDYTSGFDLFKRRILSIQGDSVMIEEGFEVNTYDVTDTTEMKILSKTVSSWDSELHLPYQIEYTYNERDYIYSEYQDSSVDTTFNGEPGKIFMTSWNYKILDLDSVVSEGSSKSYYVQDIGFYESKTDGPTFKRHTELVEQMSIEEFEKRAAHGEHRVAWIDPEATMSDDSNFKICGHERRIADYYNSTPDGRYIHSKRSMLDTINANLDKAKLFEQTGRLVFRFVVNCEGEAGRFVAEGYDLNYQPMEFEKETVDHLFGILQKLKKWRPVVIREEARDAYFYITFNIVDGEIQDILP